MSDEPKAYPLANNERTYRHLAEAVVASYRQPRHRIVGLTASYGAGPTTEVRAQIEAVEAMTDEQADALAARLAERMPECDRNWDELTTLFGECLQKLEIE